MAPDLRTRVERRWHDLWLRGRLLFRLPVAPDSPPAQVPARPPTPDPHREWRRQLDRTRATLELTREALARDGWIQGGWFADAAEARLLDGPEAYARLSVTAGRTTLGPACLVGTLLKLAEDPDRPTTIADARHAVDELSGALDERDGWPATTPGTAYPLSRRRLHVRALTRWNDEPGRRAADVVDLVDRAVARTIVGACS